VKAFVSFARFTLGTKLVLLALCPVLLALGAVVATLLVQRSRLAQNLDAAVNQQANSEGAKIAHNAYLLCASTEMRNQKDLSHGLRIAQDLVAQAGAVLFGDESATWKAVDQITLQTETVSYLRSWLARAGSAKWPRPPNRP